MILAGGIPRKTVKEVSRLTGVSIRALHHYDAIGLLKPSRVSEAGYRFYDGEALKRLQTILLFRQLQFPLKQIKAILDSPDFDPASAIADQIRLLELQREHLDNLIRHARQIQKEGITMEFSVFDNRFEFAGLVNMLFFACSIFEIKVKDKSIVSG